MKPKHFGTAIVAAVFLGLTLSPAGAQLTVGAGATVNLGTGTLDLGCQSLSAAGIFGVGGGTLNQALDVTIPVGGTLNGETGTLNVGGDWDNSGTFNAGSGTVNFVDDCSQTLATISGDSTFSTLNLNTTSGKTYELASGSTQTVSGSISLTGDSTLNRLVLRSTTGSSEASFNVTGSQNIAFVDVTDNHATGDTMTAGPGSVDGGNTDGWFIGTVVPALPWVGLAVLAFVMVWSGRLARRVTARA